jgi:hypothetical protein
LPDATAICATAGGGVKDGTGHAGRPVTVAPDRP